MAKKRTELVRKLLNGIGYDIRRLQTTHVHEQNPGLSLGHDKGFDGFETIIPKQIKQFDIFFRCCAGVEIFGQSRKRLGEVSKSEVLLRSLNSIIRSISYARSQGLTTPIKLTCVDDHSDATVVAQIHELLAKADCETQFIALEVTGNGPSLGQVWRMAKAAPDVIYSVEDDYIHSEVAIFELIMSFERLVAVLERDVVLFPCDKSDRYRHIDQTQVFLGSHRHWRTIQSTTATLITTQRLMNSHWERFIAMEKYGIDPDVTEEITIDRIYKEVPCLSPMPSLAVHHQQIDTLPPYVDWKLWWEQSALK